MRRIAFAFTSLLLLAGCVEGGPRKYVVFFPERSTELDSAAQAVISHVAEKADTSDKIMVEGYSPAVGDLNAEELLATKRVQVVSEQLKMDGVGPANIIQSPRGPTSEAKSVGARRVDLEIVSP